MNPLRERPPENEISSAPLDLARLKALLRQPIVVDLRNIYRPDEMARHGFTYLSVGASSRISATIQPQSRRSNGRSSAPTAAEMRRQDVQIASLGRITLDNGGFSAPLSSATLRLEDARCSGDGGNHACANSGSLNGFSLRELAVPAGLG